MELIVHDDYIEDFKSYFSTSLLGLADLTSQYIKIMTTVRENGIKAGETANALEAFISQVSMETTDNNISADVISNTTQQYCDNFLEQIDDADEELYD